MVQKALPFEGKHTKELFNGMGRRSRFQKARDWFLKKFSIPAVSFVHDRPRLEFFSKALMVDEIPYLSKKDKRPTSV